jgi:ferredoxin
MPHVVTDRCELCRYTECVSVCPVECFHADEQRLYIDPVVCIDCGACVPACPVRAVSDLFDLPESARDASALNAERSKILPLITQRQPPLETAERRRRELGF